jgi:hypothetical protein
MSGIQKKAEKLINLLDIYLSDYYYMDITRQSSEEDTEDEIIATGHKLLLLLKNCVPPTKKYSQLFFQIEDCLCHDFLVCDFCQKRDSRLTYYKYKNIERLVCTECYFYITEQFMLKMQRKQKMI